MVAEPVDTFMVYIARIKVNNVEGETRMKSPLNISQNLTSDFGSR